MKRDQKARERFLGDSRPFGWRITADGSFESDAAKRKALASMRRIQKASAMQARSFEISHQGVKQTLAREAGQ